MTKFSFTKNALVTLEDGLSYEQMTSITKVMNAYNEGILTERWPNEEREKYTEAIRAFEDSEFDFETLKTVYREYKVLINEGKWHYSGKVSFFGSHDSGIDPLNFWADDGERGRIQGIRVFCSRWQDMLNQQVRCVRYHYHDGLREWHIKENFFTGVLNNGRGSQGIYDLHFSQ